MKSQVSFKYIGMALASLPLAVIGYALIFSTLHAFLWVAAGLALLNLFVLTLLPRVFKSTALHEIQSGGWRVFQVLNKIVVSLALFFVYILGVGLVFILSRLAGKKFLQLSQLESTWVKSENKRDYSEM